MKHIVVDIETNGTWFPEYSMVSIGAVYHEDPSQKFYVEMRPLNNNFQPRAYEVNGFSHEQVLGFPPAEEGIKAFYEWVTRIMGHDTYIKFVSDTTAFDHHFVSGYLWTFVGKNPFGHAPTSLTNLFKGVTGDMRARIDHLRDTKHTHNALDDAIGNHEAFTKIQAIMAQRQRDLRVQGIRY